MAGKGGNLNPTGRNQYSPRPAGSLYSVGMENTQARNMLRGLGEQARNSTPAILAAHLELAGQLQYYQGESLLKSITRRGRMQRKKSLREGSLFKALTGEKNRTVTLDGWTVGYMGDPARVGNVAKYATIQEEGTEQFLGDVMYGWWLNPNRVGPQKGAVDAIGFEFYNFYGQQGQHSWKIEHAIEGYHYQTRGFQDFRNAGYTGRMALAVYDAAFHYYKIDFNLTMRGATGRRGYVRDLTFTKSF